MLGEAAGAQGMESEMGAMDAGDYASLLDDGEDEGDQKQKKVVSFKVENFEEES